MYLASSMRRQAASICACVTLPSCSDFLSVVKKPSPTISISSPARSDTADGLQWAFSPIAQAGTRVTLELRFETSDPIGGIVIGPAFEQACNQLVDAFGRRARQVYGAR